MCRFGVRVWLVCFIAFVSLGCGSSLDNSSTAGPEPQSLRVNPVFQSMGLQVKKEIDWQGGSLEVFARDGTRFVLAIPPGAVGVNTTFTLEPVAVSGKLSLPIALPFAVQIGPTGTQFTRPANLDITLPSGVDATKFNPYLMDDSGSPMSLRLGKTMGQTISFTLSHLSTPGLSPDSLPNPASSSSSPADSFEAEIAFILRGIEQVDRVGGDSRVLRELLERTGEDYFDNILLPALRVASASGNDQQCETALSKSLAFEVVSQRAGFLRGITYQAQLQPLNISLLNRGIDQVIANAVTAQRWPILLRIQRVYQPLASFLGLNTQTNNLSTAAIQAGIPIEVVITAVNLPSTITRLEPFGVTAAAGYRLGAGNPILTDQRLTAQIQVTGAQATPTTGLGFINNLPASQPDFGTLFTVLEADAQVAFDVSVVFDAFPDFQFSASQQRVITTEKPEIEVAPPCDIQVQGSCR